MKKTYSLIALALLCVLSNCEKKAEDTATPAAETAAPMADAAAPSDGASTDAAAPAAE